MSFFNALNSILLSQHTFNDGKGGENKNMSKRQITLGTWDGSPIQWIVLKEQDGKALCISKNILFSRCFNSNRSDGHQWADSDIRKYLNHDFYEKAFTVDEKKKIVNTYIKDEMDELKKIYENHGWGWNPVTKEIRTSKDNIFLLSFAQAENHMTQNERNLGTYWWLRSPYVNSTEYTWSIRSDGNFDYSYVSHVYGIRPALYLKS